MVNWYVSDKKYLLIVSIPSFRASGNRKIELTLGAGGAKNDRTPVTNRSALPKSGT
ncbi:hypothetical protein AGMMS50268_20850 [Spirochaetia bacterium]|nr:hypothetical protein AGMMS50268_20850 [Spirochaetia bacterium]